MVRVTLLLHCHQSYNVPKILTHQTTTAETRFKISELLRVFYRSQFTFTFTFNLLIIFNIMKTA